MKILEAESDRKVIKIEIPLTRPTGKVRIKERLSYTDFLVTLSPVPVHVKVFCL